jgi:DNA-binding beta-propeller fold protein YncE
MTPTRPHVLRRLAAAAALAAASFAANAGPLDGASLVWTQKHAGTPTGFASEIVSFDAASKTLWVSGVNGVQVLDAPSGTPLSFIPVPTGTAVNSVAIHNGIAAFALESTVDRKGPGQVQLYSTTTRALLPGINTIAVGSLPDMLTFTPDGSKLLVANEGTPNSVADQAYSLPDPKGTVSIIDMASRSVAATAVFDTVAPVASNRVFAGQTLVRTPRGYDAEPEYISVNKAGTHAFVTLQEANAVATIDLATNQTTRIVGLGAKDFSKPGNEIDPRNGGGLVFNAYANVRGLYQPDGIAAFESGGQTFYVIAGEGDIQEDNGDRANASAYGFGGDLSNLRVSNADSSTSAIYTFGSRSISIRNAAGDEVWDSGSTLDREAAKAGLYNDARSPEKGVEPEDVKVLAIGGRTYAFVGLERTTRGAIAVFDISDPGNASFVRLLLTGTTELRPEGLHAFEMDGFHWLAVANEGSNATTFGTSLFQLAPVPEPGTWALMALGLAGVAGAARRRRSLKAR